MVKEKIRLRNVLGGRYSRVKKTHFDRLSLAQKDEIRKFCRFGSFMDGMVLQITNNKFGGRQVLFIFKSQKVGPLYEVHLRGLAWSYILLKRKYQLNSKFRL